MSCYHCTWRRALVERVAVDLAVVALADLAAEDGGGEGDRGGCEKRDDPAGRQRPGVDRDVRQVELGEDVVLRAEDRARDGGDDRDDQAEDPHPEALPRAVEARHAARHVAARVVREPEDDEQDDAGHETDRLGRTVGQAEGRAGGAGDGREDDRDADGDEPTEERRPPVDAAELLALTCADGSGAGRALAVTVVELAIAMTAAELLIAMIVVARLIAMAVVELPLAHVLRPRRPRSPALLRRDPTAAASVAVPVLEPLEHPVLLERFPLRCRGSGTRPPRRPSARTAACGTAPACSAGSWRQTTSPWRTVFSVTTRGSTNPSR